MLDKFKLLWQELQQLGLKRGCYRILYELVQRSKLEEIVFPAVNCEDWWPETVTFREWQTKRPRFFIHNTNSIQQFLKAFYCDAEQEHILKMAEEATVGKIKCFSNTIKNYQNPIDWHYQPDIQKPWPSKIHYSQILRQPRMGDVKLTWELNRFPHVYYFIRAYALTHDNRWVEAFVQQVVDWDQQNPYRCGVNWSNGQELAIRALAWLAAIYAFGDNFALQEKFPRLQKLLYLHAWHIRENIHFARYAVHNNHLIGEALALYAIGSLFPWFDRAKIWKDFGQQLLEGECLQQFYNDGGYCQCSHNYQRLALHYYVWACRIGEELKQPLSSSVYQTLQKSSEYLAQFMNSDGKLPNWGANDGALLQHFSNCDYSDFRPLLTVLRYLTKKTKAFPEGPWDQELLWFFGPNALSAPVVGYSLQSSSFPTTGLHVLRRDAQNFAVLRCGSVIDRFGQADQLHCDVWWQGLNIAMDGGSFSYTDHKFHRHFMSAFSHNTITIDDQDQMFLYRPFKWLYWTIARLNSFSENSISGEHYSYVKLPGRVIHQRSVDMDHHGYSVVDHISQNFAEMHKYRLQWLLGDFTCSIVSSSSQELCIECATVHGNFLLKICCNSNMTYEITKSYFSRYYGKKSPAASIVVYSETQSELSFRTLFQFTAF